MELGLSERPKSHMNKVEPRPEPMNKRETLFGKALTSAYRGFHSKVVEPMILPWVSKRDRVLFPSGLRERSEGFSQKKKIWFHAASVGELESLWPIILMAAEDRLGLIVTILSPSA